jgi:hypothetical protein
VASNPNRIWLTRDTGGGDTGVANGYHEGFRDATMLSYWGSIVIESNTTGFAMEFIGDMNDSAGGNTGNCESVKSKGNTTDYRMCVSSGVNLQ